MVGDKSEMLHHVTGKVVSPAIFHLRSAVWPGFHTFYKDGAFFRVYIGDGQKYTTCPYFPRLVSNVQEDAPDPTPSDEMEAPAPPEEDAKPVDQ